MESTAAGPAGKAAKGDPGRSVAARSGRGRAALPARVAPARAAQPEPLRQADPSQPRASQPRASQPTTSRTTLPRTSTARTSTARAGTPPSASYPRADRPPGQNAAGIGRLLGNLAPLLGLDPGEVRLRLVPGAEAPHGSAAGPAVTLTGAFDPAARPHQALLLHELAHVRQHRNRGTGRARPDQSAAEAEAAGLAEALRQGRPLWVPRQAVPDGHLARDGGATGIAPQSAPDTAPAAPPVTAPDVAALERSLDRWVAANHAADVRTLTGLLDHPGTQVSEEMVENSLRLLAPLRFVVARALVRALEPRVRSQLAQLRPAHHQQYPDQAVAVLSSLNTPELAGLVGRRITAAGPTPGVAAVFAGLDPARLSPIARRALLGTLRRLGTVGLGELVASNREVFRPLLQAAPDPGTDEAELRAAIGEEQALSAAQLGSDDILLDQLTGLLRDGGRKSAQEALRLLAPLRPRDTADTPASLPAAGPPGTTTLEQLRAAAAAPASTGDNSPPRTTAQLVGLVARLDALGLVDRLIDSLPEADRRDDVNGPVLRRVLAARAPLPNLSRATELLSYGLLDWKIFDSEARLAYLLVRSTPIPAQDSWRQLDNGKWLGRLQDNLPDDMFSSGEYTGVGSEYSTGASGVPAALLQDYAETLIARYQRSRTPATARELVRELLGLDPTGRPKPWLTDNGAASRQDPALRAAIVRRIDARARLNEMVQNLPDDYLFGEQGRIELLDLNQLRDPVQLRRQALALAPSGLGWLTFSHRDAWLAMQALRALSPDDQQRFDVENPGVWTTLWAGLTAEMRRALPTTLATGRDPKLPTRAALRDRISDERLWTEASAAELRALIDLAYAADDRAWVFEKSRELRADLRARGNPLLTALVADLRLYSEADHRTGYVPEQTDPSRAPVWGYGLGVVGRALGLLLYDWLIERSIDLSGKTMHLRGFDLGDLQSIVGGDLEGATLAPSSNGANKIDVATTFESGFIVNVDLKDLELQGVNLVSPGKSIRSGPVSVKGLKASAGFSDRGYTDPTYLVVSLDSLALRDLVLIDPALPLSHAWAVSRLGLQRLDFRASGAGTDDLGGRLGQQLPRGTIPIPIFGPMFQLLKNLVALKGGIPGDYTLLDYAMLPLDFVPGLSARLGTTAGTLLGKAANTGAGMAADAAFPTPAPASYLWGLASDGVLRPPYSAAQRMTDALGMLRAFNVSVQSLAVEGISIGSGQQIRSLVLTDLDLGVGQSLPAYLNTAIATLRLAKSKLPPDSPRHADLDARIATLTSQAAAVQASPRIQQLRARRASDPHSLTDAERAELAVADRSTADEDRLRVLEGKDRWHPGSLTADERRQLVELTRRLRSDVGLTARVGSITLGPLTGDLQAGGVTLTGLAVQARLPNTGLALYAPGYLDDRSLVEQFVDGGPRVPTLGELAHSAEFSLTVDSTRLLNTDPSQPAVILKADRLPRAVEVQSQLAALPELEGNRPIRDRLARALEVLVALERAEGTARLGSTPEARNAAAQRVRELTDDARRLLGIEIGGLRFGRITGELDPATGMLTATVHDTVATGVAGPGFAVDELTGSLRVSLSAGGLTARKDQLAGTDPATLVSQLVPSAGLSGVTATGIHLPQGLVGRVSLGTLTGSLQATDKGYRIPDLFLDHLEIDDIALGRPGDGITGRKVTVDRLGMDVEVELTQTATGSTLTGATIHSLTIGAIGGEHLVLDMPRPDGTLHAELVGGSLHDIAATEVVFDKGSEGWDLVQASGSVGSVTDLRYSVLLGALKGGATTVTGTLATGPDAIAHRRPTVTARYARAGGRTFSLDVADLRALGTDISTPDGSVRIRSVTLAAGVTGALEGEHAGIRASATLTGLVLGPIDWRAGTARVTGLGPVTARTVTVAAVYTPAVPAAGNQKAKPAAWAITDIVITSLEGSGLRYLDPPLDLHLGRSDKPATAADRAPLTIGRVHLQPARNKVTVKDLSVDFGGDLKSSLQVNGHLGMDYLSMELHRDGHVVATVRGVSAEAALTGDYTGTVELKGLMGATVDIGPDAIRIGSDDPNDSNGMLIDQVSISSLRLSSESGHKFTLSTLPNGRLDLFCIRAKVRIDKWQPGEKHNSKSAFKQVAVEHLQIDEVNLGAFQLDLPDDGVSIIVPARKDGDPPTMRRLHLSGGVGADGRYHPEFVFNLDTSAIEGWAGVDDITLPISAHIKNKFSGDVVLRTWSSSIDFLTGGGIKIDVQHPELTMAKVAELGPGQGVRVAKLGADRLRFADGRLYVKRPYAQDLTFTQKIGDSLAVWLKVKDISLDEFNYDTAAGGSLLIPHVGITDAFLALDVAALTAKAPGQPQTESNFDLDALRPAVDATEGDVRVVMYVSAGALGLKDFRIGSTDDPLVIPIHRGAIHIPSLERNLKGKVYSQQIGSGFYLRPWVVNAVAEDPILRLVGSQLQLGVYVKDPPDVDKGNKTPRGQEPNRPDSLLWLDILTWDLRPPDLAAARHDRFSLWTAIFDLHKSPPLTEEDKAKETAEQKEERKKKERDLQATLDSLELRSLEADLQIQNSGPLPLRIRSDAAAGTVTLSDKALMNLHVGGSAPAVTPPEQRAGARSTPGAMSFGLDAVKVDSVDLSLFDRDAKGGLTGVSELRTGHIKITELSEGHLSFDDLFHPQRFTASIKQASADNIRWYRS
ncbi:MAG: hypothetical protein JO144_13055 [Actinobacteria bacterium]|nr:hypothetical protein [Actinomycetota bacterium]